MRAVEERRVAERMHDLSVVKPLGRRLRHGAHVVRGVVEHTEGDQFAGVERLRDGRLYGFREPVLADVNEGILIVRKAAKVGALARSQSVGHWAAEKRKRGNE